jgi:glyoxylate reductase
MRPQVLVLNPMPPVFFEMLPGAEFRVLRDDGERAGLARLLASQPCDALCSYLSNAVGAGILDAAGTRLRIVANYAVGYNNIDVTAAGARDVAATNTPGVLTDATADLTMGLLLATARRVAEGDRSARTGVIGRWAWDYMVGGDLGGRVLGIVGFGRIGQAVARRAFGFGMEVIYTARGSAQPPAGLERARSVSFDEVLAQSDFISIHCPLKEETHHLFDESVITKMKPSSYLINTARGAIVDEAALVKALREKRIAGAGLDVYENEPALAPGLAELDNVVLTPHVGSATVRTRDDMGVLAARNVMAALRGEMPPNCLNPGDFAWLGQSLL